MRKTIRWDEKKGKGSYLDPKLNHFINPPQHGFDDELLLAKEASQPQKGRRDRQFWVSIRKAKDCLYSRRNGHQGKIILGYSCMLRLFGYDLLNRHYNYPDLKQSHFFWLRIFKTFKK